MKAIRILIPSVVLWMVGAMEAPASLLLRFEPAGVNLRLIFDSQTGTNYQVQISTNLSGWTDLGTVITGDGLSKTQVVSTAGQRLAFFRVRGTQTSAGPAPSDAEFTAVVVGKIILGYSFQNATRFSWFGELGNWDYTRIDSMTGKLIFTYDEDGNNLAIYREEVVLTFQTPTQGTYRYSEFNFGVEDAGSVATGMFDFNNP
jgi:hypothetical protein